MTSPRTFHRTVLKVEILSEDPYNFEDLAQVDRDITTGDCSGKTTIESSEKMDGKRCAEGLAAQGSDPGFFGLTDDGEDL